MVMANAKQKRMAKVARVTMVSLDRTVNTVSIDFGCVDCFDKCVHIDL